MLIVLIALLFVLITFIILNELYKKTNDYKNKINDIKKFDVIKNESVFINTGSTFAYYGYDFDFTGVNSINLAMKPQCIEKDFLMLKSFQKKYKENAIVLITIADLAFAKIKYEDRYADEKYYGVLKRKDIANYSLLKFIIKKYLPVLSDWKNFVRFLRDKKQDDDFQSSLNENDIDHIKNDAYERVKGWCTEFGLSDFSKESYNEKFKDEFNYNKEILRQMINWCEDNNYRPVLVNLPISKEMKKYFTDDFLQYFYYDNINDIINTYDIPFIDFFDEPKLDDYLLYLDSCRLNKEGRRIVTKLLVNKLKRIGYEY